MVKVENKDAERFLALLEQRVTELLEISHYPKNNPDGINFDDYSQFREMMAECLSFMVIIERRISQQDVGQKERLLEQFDTLTAAVWSILLDGALGYLMVICERDHLPLGSKHVFVQELKTLHDAEKILGEGKYEKHLISTAMEQRAKAEKILNMVIDRAPQMLDLG